MMHEISISGIPPKAALAVDNISRGGSCQRRKGKRMDMRKIEKEKVGIMSFNR